MCRIELLAGVHDRQGVDCGSEPLNLFLRQTARQHAERGISRTFVLVKNDSTPPKAIVGYFSLTVCQVRAEVFEPSAARNLPREVPALKLGRLAVAVAHQRRGFGRVMLVAAMTKFMDVFEAAGGIGMFVDAKDENARRYYEQFGFVSLLSNPLQLFLPVDTIREALDEAGE